MIIFQNALPLHLVLGNHEKIIIRINGFPNLFCRKRVSNLLHFLADTAIVQVYAFVSEKNPPHIHRRYCYHCRTVVGIYVVYVVYC